MAPISEFNALRRYERERDHLDARPESINLPVMEGTGASSSSNAGSQPSPSTTEPFDVHEHIQALNQEASAASRQPSPPLGLPSPSTTEPFDYQ